EREGTSVRHHEIAADVTGKTIYDQAVDVHYALGSGAHGRSYITDRGGVLFMSPLSWYSKEGQGTWDISPNYPSDGLRFERRIVDLCLACHVGLANPQPGAEDRFETPPFLEMSIGCERCHGPGKEHVELHRTMAAGDTADPIVNPSKLDPSRRDAVCLQCHLQGQDRVLRYGRTDFDFRPGMHLGDVWTVLLEGPGVAEDDSTKAVGHGEQMLSSRCYQNSQGRLGCVSCHDTHPAGSHESAVDHYRRKCLECHAGRGCSEPLAIRLRTSAADSCVDCHMPPRDTNDVPHTSRTDHRIVRRRNRLGEDLSDPGETGLPQLFDADIVNLSPRELDRARGLLLSKRALRQESAKLGAEVERLLTPWSQAAQDDLPVLNALALAAVLQQRPERATAYWQAMLAISPENETALLSLALQAIALGRQQEALRYLDRYLAVNPWKAGMHAQRSLLLAGSGRDAEAIVAAKRAIELDPSLADAYRCLAALSARRGQAAEAQRYEALYRRFAR
ncbi:MAG TPA: tetratricopeptide repeat protein, partial [Planctomycetaceae bacterium]